MTISHYEERALYENWIAATAHIKAELALARAQKQLKLAEMETTAARIAGCNLREFEKMRCEVVTLQSELFACLKEANTEIIQLKERLREDY